MAEHESTGGESSGGERGTFAFQRAKRHFLLSCGAIGVGLAVSGTFSQTAGGALVLVGAVAAIFLIHRLGRAGADDGSVSSTK